MQWGEGGTTTSSMFEEMGARGLGRDTVLRSPHLCVPRAVSEAQCSRRPHKARDGLIPVTGLSSGPPLGRREVCRRFTGGPPVGGTWGGGGSRIGPRPQSLQQVARADPGLPARINQPGGWPLPEEGMDGGQAALCHQGQVCRGISH